MSLGPFSCLKSPHHARFQHCTPETPQFIAEGENDIAHGTFRGGCDDRNSALAELEAKHCMSFGSIDTLSREVNVFTTNKLLIRYQSLALANTPRGMSLQAEVTALKAKNIAIRAVNAALLPATLGRVLCGDTLGACK